MEDADRRTLADIEQRLTDEDPVLSLLARRLSAESQRRARRERSKARGLVAPHPHPPQEVVRRTVVVAAVAVVVVGIALGLWIVALSGSVAVTFACLPDQVTCRP